MTGVGVTCGTLATVVIELEVDLRANYQLRRHRRCPSDWTLVTWPGNCFRLSINQVNIDFMEEYTNIHLFAYSVYLYKLFGFTTNNPSSTMHIYMYALCIATI